MAILSDRSLKRMLHELIVEGADPALINPASIDIRLGKTMLREYGNGQWSLIDLSKFSEDSPAKLFPGEFVLISTFENICVPNGYVVELKLKSSRARDGYDHALAFHVDPGWRGVLTMEVKNVRRFKTLPVWYGMKFAQILVHTLDDLAETPYNGHYQNALGVEGAKQ